MLEYLLDELLRKTYVFKHDEFLIEFISIFNAKNYFNKYIQLKNIFERSSNIMKEAR